MTYQELQDALKICYTTQQLAEYFNINSNKIYYWLKKYNLKPLLNAHAKDERGNKYGKLTVIDFSHIDNKNQVCWNCICDCGTLVTRPGVELRRARAAEPSCQECVYKKISIISFKNHTGEIHGNLTVLKPTGKRKSGNITWLCKCKCGNFCTVTGSVLNNNTPNEQLSCGCKQSKGEYFINQILNELNILYKTQVSFDDCRGSISNAKYKFDFGIYNKEQLLFLIEYNGIQHYQFSNTGWNTEEKLKQIQFRDNEKIQYCKNNNIPLLIIPYTISLPIDIKNTILQFIKNNNFDLFF